MRSPLIIVALSAALPLSAQSLVVDAANSPFLISAQSTFSDVTVAPGGRLVVNDRLIVTGDMSVAASGVVTHDPEVLNMHLDVTGTLEIQVGGRVDVQGMGLGIDRAFDITTQQVVNAPGSAGGSHGGVGTAGALAIFGDARNPTRGGSGGGAGSAGAGGGYVRITAGTVILSGEIDADGNNATALSCISGSGGGAGGGVLINAGSFTGAGSLRAVGGVGRGAGGGGRIAIFADTNTFAGTISAVGATGCGATAGTGTVHIESPAGDVLVQGGANFIGSGDSYNSVTLGPGAQVHITGAATVIQTVSVPLGGRLTLASTNALDNLSVDPVFQGIVVLDAPFTFAEDLRVEGALHVNQPLTVQGNLTVASGGTVTHDPGRAAGSVTADRVEVESGGSFDVSGKGFGGGTAFDPATQTTGSAPNAGGSHGGDGGGGSLGPYGSALDPRTIGSGGTAAAGGGVVLIRATDLVVNGAIRASAANATSTSCISGNGGGGGGSVNIDVTNLSGSGTLSANGGSGRFGGGGGRVAAYFTSNTFAGSVEARGGTSTCGFPGEDGTIHIESPANDLVVGQGVLELGAGDSYNSVTLNGGATLRLDGPATVTEPIVVGPGATLEVRSSDALSNLVIDSTIAGTLVIRAPVQWPNGITIQGVLELVDTFFVNGDVDLQAGAVVTHPLEFDRATLEATGLVNLRVDARFDVTGRGFNRGRAFDPASQQVVSAPAGGGSHGGEGGGTTLGIYGNPQAPLTLGSGGNGGAGGGRAHVVAAEIIVDGDILADGSAASSGSCISGQGGGAGGSVFLEAGVIRGNGLISARGGGGRFAAGGGRVALATPDEQHSGDIRVDAGASTCGFPAGQGSVLLDPEGGSLELTTGSVTISDLDNYTDVNMASGTTLFIAGAATVDAPITVPTGATVVLATSDALTNLDIGQVNGRLEVLADVSQLGSMLITGVAVVDRALVVQDLDVAAGGVVTHSPGALGMHLITRGTLSVAFGARIDADGRGLAGAPSAGFGAAGATRSPTTSDVVSGSGATNGGSHTAQGGQFSGGNAIAPPFDDAAAPVFGGGGGGQGTGGEAGGAGGGVVRVDAGVLVVDGTISADGVAGAADAGGGAGGSVVILADDLSGGAAGRITAVGGDSGGGGGAGGVALVRFGFSDFTGLISAAAGNGATPGAAGVEDAAATTLPPSILTTPPTVGSIGVEYVYDAAAAGSRPITFSLSVAPPGATVDAEGVVRFTPAAGGLTSFTLVATNAAGSDTQSFTVSVGAPPTITSTPATDAFVGVPYLYNAQRSATADGQGPFTWTATLAPAGFAINASTGEITWTPNSQGTFDACISVTNGAGNDQDCWQVNVGVGSGDAPSITSTPSLVVVRGEAYAYDDDDAVDVDGGTPLTFTLDPAAPGMSIDAAGVVTWTPDVVGQFPVCVVVTNPFGVDAQCFSIDVVDAPAPPRFISTPTVGTPVGAPYAYDADGRAEAIGPGAITYAVVEGPEGLTIDADTGLVTFTPDVVGSVPVTLAASNVFGGAAQSFAISVLPVDGDSAPVIVQDANLVGAVGQPYAYNADGAARAGGEAPFTWLLVGGPTGFAIDEASGLVSWTPQAAGPATVTLGVNNAFGADTYSFTVNVVEDVPAEPIAIATGAPTEGDAPLTVAFDGAQSFGPEAAPIVGYQWTFGPGEVGATGPTAEHTYQTPGSRVARLTVSNVFGARAVDSVVIRVGEGGVVPPSARILISQVEGADQLDVSFACECDAGSSRILSHSWDLGDGTVVDSAAFSHTFGPGGYNVRLTVVDENGLTATDEVFIRVSDGENAPPLVVALAAPTGGPAPLDVQLSALAADTDGEVDTLVWTLPDGSTTEERAPAITLEEPGVYEAVLEAVDDDGLSSTATVTLEVVAPDLARAPQIVSVGAAVALATEPYQYDADNIVAARGTQPIAWSLGKVVAGETVGAPAGMSIDAATGALSWTPEAGGEELVVIVATNSAGVSTQEYTVDVEGLPDVVVEPEGCGCSAQSSEPATPAALGALFLLFAALRRSRR